MPILPIRGFTRRLNVLTYSAAVRFPKRLALMVVYMARDELVDNGGHGRRGRGGQLDHQWDFRQRFHALAQLPPHVRTALRADQSGQPPIV